jgi:cobalt-zinc-cadmium resistance protein CzcA
VLSRLVEFALTQRLLMMLAAALILAAGWWAYQSTPIDAFPDFHAANQSDH